MTPDEIVSLVLSRLGKRGANTFLLAQAMLELAHIQRVAERGAILPWFLLSTEQSLAITANTRMIALPATFLREWDEWPLMLYDATVSPVYQELIKDDFDLLMGELGGSAASSPTKYDLVGSNVAVFPLASVDKVGRWVYFQSQAAPAAGGAANNWTTYAEDFMVAKLGIVMSRYIRSDLLPEFKSDLADAMQRMNTEDVARKNAARDAYRGS